MIVEFFSRPNLNERMCTDWGSNQRPLDSQSDSLPTALGGPAYHNCFFSSPEPLGSQGELIVYPCSGVRCRHCRCRGRCRCRRRQQ